MNANKDPKPTGLMTTEEVAEMLRLTPRALSIWANRGYGPRRYMLSTHCARYKLEEVLEWVESRSG